MKPIYSFTNFEAVHTEELEDFDEDYNNDLSGLESGEFRPHSAKKSRRLSMPTSPNTTSSPQFGNNTSFSGHQRTGTVAGVTMNTLCNVMGAGVLALPLAFHNGSVVVSLFLLVLSAYISLKAVHILGLGCDAVHRYSFTECVVLNLFPADIEERRECIVKGIDPMLNSKRRLIATLLLEFVIVVESIGTLVVYTRVIADSLPPVLEGLGLDHPYIILLVSWVLPSALFFLLSCSRSMEELKWTSLIGFGTILYIVVVVVYKYFEFVYVHSPAISGYGGVTPPADQSTYQFSMEGVRWFSLDLGCFSTMSTYALAYGYHFNVPYFYSELQDRKPTNLLKTVHYALPIVTISYALTGVLGYLQVGLDVAGKGGGNIVDRMDNTSFLVNIGRIGLLFHFATVYPVISVCARRGLHRLIALTVMCVTEGVHFEKSIQSSRQVSQDRLTEEDVAHDASEKGETSGLTSTKVASYDATAEKQEQSPSAKNIQPASSVKRSPSLRAQKNHARFADSNRNETSAVSDTTPTIGRLGGKMPPRNFSVNSFSNLPTTGRPAVPGDPQTTTKKSIVAEALFIVACSTLCAWYVPGVGLVIEVLGAFVGIPTMMVLPGVIGLRLFGDSAFVNRWWMSHVKDSFPSEKRISVFLIVVGVICTFFGIVGAVNGGPTESHDKLKDIKEHQKERDEYLKDTYKGEKSMEEKIDNGRVGQVAAREGGETLPPSIAKRRK